VVVEAPIPRTVQGVKILGIDLAAEPKNTGVVLVDWDSGGAVAHLIADKATESTLVALARKVDKIGVDAPLGWPVGFVEAMTSHSTYAGWPPGADRTRLRYRVTDHVVQEITGIWPLSVSTDKLGVVALRCAHLQELFAAEVWNGTRAPRDGSGPLVETYPTAALKAWGLRYRGYKREEGRGVRQVIVDELQRRVELEEVRESAIHSDHVLDALISALLVIDVVNHTTLLPRNEEEQVAALAEGWIHVPTTVVP